jgi:acyl transferase domain-containing protein
MSGGSEPVESNVIAIVGLAGKFPGAPTLEQFWRNLRDGREAVVFFSDDELIEAGIPETLVKNPRYVKAKALLEGAELFDAGFFGYTPREAELMDPQHRLFLECAWEAFENAGYDARNYGGAIGVFAGTNLDTYLLENVRSGALDSLSSLELRLSSDNGFLATRVSYKLNLRGPAVTIQTACSTSLVAVCQACQSLATYQCDMALAGAATVKTPRKEGYPYQEGSIASPDGHCRAFDADAKGTLPGEGVAAIVLKRLEDALADGDTIHALIRGWALNNDGDAKVGYTAPSVAGQAEVIALAHALAGIDADTISYVEAHGTGTELGDPIEIAALTQAFAATTTKTQSCAIGSVKTNIGHLDAAAGIAGLLKTVLALEAGELPPHLHFRKANPRIDFAAGPFFVNTELAAWPRGAAPRRAGVSSFGIGGTNAHVVLEEAPPSAPSDAAQPYQLLLLSARSERQLEAAMDGLAAWLADRPDTNLADVAHTLSVGRRLFPCAAMLVCRDVQDASDTLARRPSGRIVTGNVSSSERSVFFMFPGQGNQYPGMGLGLYRSEPRFRRDVDECSGLLRHALGLDLRDVLYGADRASAAASEELTQTRLAQPALFVVEYALARCLMDFGIEPQAFIGHSLGEYVAACLAGVFSLEDALRIVALRGSLMQQAPPGAMTAVALSADALTARLAGGLSLAAVNEPGMSVASGPVDAIARLEAALAAQGTTFHRLRTSHAFHSPLMESAARAFERELRAVRFSAPRKRFVSNLTGTWITPEQATDPCYWASQLRGAVRFADGVGTLLETAGAVLVEIGPGTSLGTMASRHPARTPGHACISSMRHARDPRDDRECLLECIGRLAMAGAAIEWRALRAGERRRRVPVPTYPFARDRYWLPSEGTRARGTEHGAAAAAAHGAGVGAAHGADVGAAHGADVGAAHGARAAAAGSSRGDPADWFHLPSWKRLAPSSPAPRRSSSSAKRAWLLFGDRGGIGARLGARLRERGDAVFAVTLGAAYAHADEHSFVIRAAERSDYSAVLATLRAGGHVIDGIVHLWALDDVDKASGDVGADDLALRCFYGPMYLVQALGETAPSGALRLFFVSAGMQVVTGGEDIVAEKALLLGPCGAIEHEYPSISCRSIDLCRAELAGPRADALLDALAGQLDLSPAARISALRGGYVWERELVPFALAAEEGVPPRLRADGVYLITGGLGGIGLALAEYLAAAVRAKLVLVGRTALPPRDRWDAWLDSHADADDTSRKIRAVRRLESLGAEIMLAAADVSRRDEMRSVVALARARFGAIHGVIHAAGVAGGGVMQLKSRERAAAVLAPKLLGTRVLDDVLGDGLGGAGLGDGLGDAGLGDARLDFMILCSSLITAVGGAGQADYIAGNAFLDAYAHERSRAGTYTVAIDWDTWSDAGMAARADVPDNVAGERSRRLRDGLTDGDGVEAFRRIVMHLLPQVAVTKVAPAELRPVLVAAAAAPSSPPAAEAAAPRSSARARTLERAHVAPHDDLERTIADIWEELFGLDGIGVEDGFFELGGHSLLAIQILSRVNAVLQTEVTLNAFFEAGTVARLAERVRGTRADASLEAMVDRLSQEEIERMLAERASAER